MSTTAPDNQLDPSFAKLELTGVSAVFNTVSGFNVSWDVTAEPVGASDTGQPQMSYRAGAPAYGDLTCQTQLSKTDTSLFTWWDEISRGVVSPKDGTLTLMTPAGTPSAAFAIVGAVLTRLETQGSALNSTEAPAVTATLNCLSYRRAS
jgi:hypothetical protein